METRMRATLGGRRRGRFSTGNCMPVWCVVWYVCGVVCGVVWCVVCGVVWCVYVYREGGELACKWNTI